MDLESGTGGEAAAADAALYAGEGRYCTLYEQIPLMYFTLAADGTVVRVNAYGAEHLGYRPEELVGGPALKVFHPEDRPAVAEELRRAVARPGTAVSWRFRKIRKDSTPLWVHETVRVVEEDARPLVLVVCEDVAEQVEIQQELERHRDELRALTAQLTLAEARERRRVAEGLHDRTGQTLVAARMKPDALREAEPDENRRRSLEEIRGLLRRVLWQTRSLTFELSSPVLYRLGLRAAIRDLGEGIESTDGLRFHFSGESDVGPLAEDQKVLLYRVVRELLANVVRHARASAVRVSLRRAEGRLSIVVEDDGVGIDVSKLRSGPTASGGFGLFAIRERLRHLGGRLEIGTAAASGTRASVQVPIEPPAAPVAPSRRGEDPP